MSLGSVALVVALVGACSGPSGPSGPSGTNAVPMLSPSEYAAQIVAATNAARVERGLPELAESECAQDAALGRATALVGADELTHADLAPVHAACSPASGIAAENLSRAAVDPAAVVDAWLGSPGHANNLLSTDLTLIGVGCVPDDGYEQGALLCAQVFLG